MKIKETKVSKATAEVYHIRHKGTSEGWGDIVVNWGKESVRVMADSDYGTYSYYWSHCGGDPKQFLTEIDMHYGMKKMCAGGKFMVKAPDKYPSDIKESVVFARKEGYLDKKQARTAWVDMLEICEEYVDGDLFFQALCDHELSQDIFGDDLSGLPNCKEESHQAVAFWNDVWVPFVSELKKELAKTHNL